MEKSALSVFDVIKDAEGNTIISNTSEVDISGITITIKDTTNDVTMEVIFEEAPKIDLGSIVGKISSAKVTYPEKIAALSPAVATATEEIKTNYMLVINLGNVTNRLLTIDPVFNNSVVNAIKEKNADAGSNKYTFFFMIIATENVMEINKNVTTSGGVEVTFTVLLDWANRITGNSLGKLKAFHLKSDGTVIMLTRSGIENVVTNTYTFTVKGDSFSPAMFLEHTPTSHRSKPLPRYPVAAPEQL